ncbi:pilin N-terminal domain-containing protein [Helcococcus bovis]|uniref:pilin N-terminal domain-containing protein n=1 Tax=Helcococcus bovis TaxID=3153252 RepID=UPI0038BBE8AA
MKKNNIMAILLAFVMVFAFVAPVTKAEEEKTNKVILHKILQTKTNFDNAKFPGKEGLDGTKYTGNQIKGIESYFGTGSKAIAGVYFAFQNKGGQWIDQRGSVVESVEQALGGLTNIDGLTLDTTNLPQDKATEYRIVEVTEKSTYKNQDGSVLADSKAVPVVITLPLVNDKGVVKEAHVYPKNTEEKPEIDKNFQKTHGLPVTLDNQNNDDAGAQYANYQVEKATVNATLGTKVPYEVKTKVDAGSRYKTLNWKDTMSNGLTFNKDLTISTTYGDDKTLVLSSEGHTPDYVITQDDRGFTLKLTDAGLTKVSNITNPADQTAAGQAVEFTLLYSATVNGNAVVEKPEKNNIELEYSNNKSEEKTPTPVTPQNGELNVSKTWSDGIGKGVNVTYTLSNKTISAAVALNGTETNGTVYDLGNGITFKVTGPYAGTFKGEALKEGNWTIAERVAGYDETINADTAGSAAITNTKDNENPTPLNPTEPKVETYGKKFVKADASTGERLQGAEFVVKNGAGKYLAYKSTTTEDAAAVKKAKANYDAVVNAWNEAVKSNPETADSELSITPTIDGTQTKLTGKIAVEEKVKELQEKYEAAVIAASDLYEWVNSKDEANVVKLVSDEQGKFEITGLAAGTYNLEEIKAPAGYALTDGQSFQFNVQKGTYSAAEGGVAYEGSESVTGTTGGAQRVNNKKVSIPQTGGIGTIIFTVAGLIIMGGAIYALKKNNQEVEA